MILALQPNGFRPRFTVADPAMWIRQGDTGKSLAEIYGENGVPLIKASNDRLSGLARVREFMADGEDDVPLLQVFSTCTQLIKNLPALVRDPHRVDDLNMDGPDDEYDALRYGTMAAHWVEAFKRRKPRDYTMGKGSPASLMQTHGGLRPQIRRMS
jgi:hypothetical protein